MFNAYIVYKKYLSIELIFINSYAKINKLKHNSHLTNINL
jgi:hypothetical protein